MFRERFEGVAAALAAATLVAAPLLALTGTGIVLARSAQSTHSVPAAADVTPGPKAGGRPAAPGAPPGDPLRVRIPAIGVDEHLVPLGLNPDGTLEVPAFEDAGWYAGGARPGDVGPAVVVAHRDSRTGPAVFYRLAELKPGDPVHVDYRDATVTFTVRESASFAKTDFPTEQVYGATSGAELRLVTCDGAFDRRARSYEDNLVVWADLTPGR